MKKKYYLIIPDVHGRTFWKESVEKFGKDAEKIIFLGDYLDPYPQEYITSDDAFPRFKEIIELKKKDPDRVILLLGNHDCHYMFEDFVTSSRFNYDKEEEYHKFYNENKDLFRFSYYSPDKILFTHAGIHPSWLKINKLELPKNDIDSWLENLDIKYYSQVGRSRGGYYPVGSSVWCDIHDFDGYKLEFPGIKKQVVGHSLSLPNRGWNYDLDEIVCLDCMGGYFLLYPEENKLEEMPSKYLDNYNKWKEEIKRRYNI